MASDDDRCCTLDDSHTGPCVWLCSDCGGTGLCPLCVEECHCDDVVSCDWCDGTHACPSGCHEGRVIDEGPL